MNNKVESVLEYDKIKNILREYVISTLAEEKILEMRPFDDIDLVKRLQQETSEGVALLKAGINLPLSGIRDIRNGLSLAKMGPYYHPVSYWR